MKQPLKLVTKNRKLENHVKARSAEKRAFIKRDIFQQDISTFFRKANLLINALTKILFDEKGNISVLLSVKTASWKDILSLGIRAYEFRMNLVINKLFTPF